MKIGFIGQGYIGKNYADDFEDRGFTVVRYALEEPYVQNRDQIQGCDFVFVAVPTPTTPEGFDLSIVEKVIDLVGVGKIAVIKSTILPGMTERIQTKNPDRTVLFSPEFLLEATAAHDAAHPLFNIVGIPGDSAVYRKVAEELLAILPESPHDRVCSSREAELFKYVHNMHGYFRIMFTNLIYDLANSLECNWEDVEEMMNLDPYLNENASYYNRPTHKGGRGAGGHCFIKDMAAFRELFETMRSTDVSAIQLLKAMEKKNIELLTSSNKDMDLLEGVYGAADPKLSVNNTSQGPRKGINQE